MTLPRQVWAVLDGRQRRMMLSLLALSVFTGFTTLGGVAAVVPFFSLLADPALLERSPWLAALASGVGIETHRGLLVLLGVGFIAVMLISSLISVLSMVAFDRFTQGVTADLQTLLFREYARRHYLYHATYNHAALANNVITEVARFTLGVLQSILMLCSSAIAATLIGVAVIALNPVVAGAAALALGGTYWLIDRLARRKLHAEGVKVARLWDERARTVALTFGAIKELLLYGAQGVFIDEFASQCRSIGRSATHNNIVAQAPKYLLEFVTAAGLVGAALFLSQTSASGSWLAELTFLCLAAYRLLPALQQAFAALARIRAHRASFEKIAGDLMRGRASGAVGAPPAHSDLHRRPRNAIELDDVSFRYSADRAAAIDQVSLKLGAGDTIGFVGANGSGKSTLADLLLGLLVPDSGRILVDGMPIDDGNRAAWQANVAYVPQSVYLLDATVTENIALGIAGAAIDAAKVRAAARAAQLEPVILGLPRGYDERLGEHGAFLSGGQRQRIGIARALYRDATFLVFDEATSSLDGLTEDEVMAALDALRGERTIIHISHRASALRNCNLIVEFENGRAVARGNPRMRDAVIACAASGPGA